VANAIFVHDFIEDAEERAIDTKIGEMDDRLRWLLNTDPVKESANGRGGAIPSY